MFGRVKQFIKNFDEKILKSNEKIIIRHNSRSKSREFTSRIKNLLENKDTKIVINKINKQSLQDKILNQIYNDDKLGLGTGLDQFYYQVCSQYIGIKRAKVRAFLRSQGNYQISRPIKKAVNQPILSKTPNEIWGMDITYMNYLQILTKKNAEGEREPRVIDPRTFGVENVEKKLTKNLNQFNDDGTKGYILTVVDFFSKKVWARALTQNTAKLTVV